MSASKPNSSSLASAGPPKKKLTRKQQEEEDERLAREAAAAAAAALAAIPPSPFERIQEVWALDGKPREQRALVGQIFGIEDGPGICIQSLTLDDTYSHLHFARGAGLNTEQTKAFLQIMLDLREQIASTDDAAEEEEEGNAGLEQAFASFKAAVMANSAVVRGKQPATACAAAVASGVASPALSNSVSGASLASPVASGRPGSTSGARPGSSSSSKPQPISVDAPARPGSRGGSGTKAGASSPSSSSRNSATGALGSPTNASTAKSTPRGSAAIAAAAAAAEEAAAADAAAAEAAAALAALPPRAFSLDNIRAITAYVTAGYFQHYRLYQAVFNARLFRPRKHVVVERLRIETVVPDGCANLDAAVELGAVRAAQQQQQQQQRAAEESKQKSATAAEQRERKEESKESGSGGVQRWTADGSRPTSAAFTDVRSASRLDDDISGGGGGDDIGTLVAQHMLKARAQMRALIADQDKMLDAKLRAVEQKVGVGAGAAAAAATTPAKASSSTKKR